MKETNTKRETRQTLVEIILLVQTKHTVSETRRNPKAFWGESDSEESKCGVQIEEYSLRQAMIDNHHAFPSQSRGIFPC